jgi:hypothetical protein
MQKSPALLRCMGKKAVAELVKHCKEAEELAAASAESLCTLQSKMDRILALHSSLDSQPNSTVFQYIQRIVYLLTVRLGLASFYVKFS